MGKIARISICTKHPGPPLSTHLSSGVAVLWCSGCEGQPAGINNRPTPASVYKAGGAIPAAMAPHLERQYGKWQTMEPKTRAVALREPDGAAITAALDMFEVTLPDIRQLRAPDQVKLTKLVAAYNLQPFHIHVQAYRGDDGPTYSMSITYEGRLFCAQQANSLGANFVGVDFRPLDADERTLNDIPDGQSAYYGWVNVMMQGQIVQRARNIGRAGPGKDDEGKRNPIAMAHKQEMAILRAKRRAIEEAAPLGVPMTVMDPDGNVDHDDMDLHEVEQLAIEVSAEVVDDPPTADGPERYDWGDPQGVPKEDVGDDERTELVNALQEAGYTDEASVRWFTFPTGETGVAAIFAAAKAGYRESQIVGALGVLNPAPKLFD